MLKSQAARLEIIRAKDTEPNNQTHKQTSKQASKQASKQPASQPASQPTNQPASQPANQPTNQPASQSASQPTSHPASQPTNPWNLCACQLSGQDRDWQSWSWGSWEGDRNSWRGEVGGGGGGGQCCRCLGITLAHMAFLRTWKSVPSSVVLYQNRLQEKWVSLL